jgi:hypothetical protein
LVDKILKMVFEEWLQPFDNQLMATSLGAISLKAEDFTLSTKEQAARDKHEACLEALYKACSLVKKFPFV